MLNYIKLTRESKEHVDCTWSKATWQECETVYNHICTARLKLATIFAWKWIMIRHHETLLASLDIHLWLMWTYAWIVNTTNIYLWPGCIFYTCIYCIHQNHSFRFSCPVHFKEPFASSSIKIQPVQSFIILQCEVRIGDCGGNGSSTRYLLTATAK